MTHPQIKRDNVLDTLQNMFSDEVRIIVVEGQEGFGKSTVLKQLHERHPAHSVAIFVSAASRYSYDPQLLLEEYCQQLARLLPSHQHPDLSLPLKRRYQQLVNALSRRARLSGEEFYFVLDGLEEIPAQDRGTRDEVFQEVPFGAPGIRCVLSGEADDLPFSASARKVLKPFQLTTVTREEGEQYLAGLGLSPDDAKALSLNSKGVPGVLASIRRLLEQGHAAAPVLAELHQRVPNLFAMEWQCVGTSEERQLLLALLSRDNRPYSISSLATIVGASAASVIAALSPLSFLQITGDGHVHFVSDSMRRAAAQALPEYRQRVDDLILSFLQRDPDSQEALANLPTFFTSTDRLSELVAYLSPERLARLYQTTPSLSQLRQHTSDAAKAARKLERRGDVVRLTLQQATLTHIAESQVRASELRALAAMGDSDGALAIAERAVRPVERLRLLVAIARAQRELGQSIEPSLRERITAVYADVLPEDIPDDATALAADLLFVSPDLAIDYVSKSRASAGGDSALDWALASLAIRAQQEGAEDSSKRARDLRDRIQDPGAQQLSTRAMMLMGGLSAAEAIEEASRVERVADQVYVLRHWMLANAKRADASEVLAYALQLVLKTRSYIPTAQVYRELATCLPYIESAHTLHYWIETLDAQRPAIAQLGPYEELIRLELLIARSLWRFDRAAAAERYGAIYDSCRAIEDPASRAASTARLLTSLRRTDAERELDTELALHQLVEEELDAGINNLLALTADHFEAVRSILEALAPTCFDKAAEIASRLNMEWRRDRAYEIIADAASGATYSIVSLDQVVQAVERIVDGTLRDRARLVLVRNLIRRGRAEQVELVGVDQQVQKLSNHGSRARLGAELSAALHSRGLATAQGGLSNLILDAFAQVDADWEKLEVGYEIMGTIGPMDAELAASIADRINGLKSQLSLLDDETSTAAILGIQLAIRAYAGLVARDLSSPHDLQRLRSAIERVGSVFDQAVLWIDLAERLWCHGRDTECAGIVRDHVQPLLDASRHGDDALRRMLASAALPAVFVGMRGAVDSLLTQLDAVERDEALIRAAWFLMRRVPVTDPYDEAPHAGFDVTWARALEIVSLMEKMEDDSALYGLIEGIVDSMTSPRYGDAFKNSQREHMALTLSRIAEVKFPAPRFIKHDGYAIAAQASISRLRERKEAERMIAPLVERARAVPNFSDRAYVICIVAQAIRDSKKRGELIDEASELAANIPLLFERSERLQTLSRVVAAVDHSRSRSLLQRALQVTVGSSDNGIARRQRSIVEELYRRDPKTAPSVASIMSGESEKRRVEERESLLKLKEALTSRHPSDDTPRAKRVMDWSRVAWMALGELNAGRAQALPPERTLEPMQYASVMSVASGYPIFAWAIENSVKHRGTEARQFLVPLFEACLAGAELALHSASRPGAAPVPREVKAVPSLSTAANVLIKDGDRQLGLSYIRDWLSEVRPSRLWILDPYFTPASLEALLLVQEAAPDCEVFILTAKSVHRRVAAPYEDTYRSEWSRLSAQEPPAVTIVLAGTIPSERCPIHDRWWLTETVGLKLGTSMNGLGGRWSDIERIAATTTAERRATFGPLFAQSLRQFEGERVTFSSLTL
jgi:hypothetical protein